MAMGSILEILPACIARRQGVCASLESLGNYLQVGLSGAFPIQAEQPRSKISGRVNDTIGIACP